MANIGYCRVSTVGHNLQTQLEALKDCDRIFQEKESGAKDDRPELEKCLDYVRDGDCLTVTKLDRLARSLSHLVDIAEFLEHKGVALKILNLNIDTSTSTGRLMFNMVAAISEFERELILERTNEGRAIAKSNGVKFGRKIALPPELESQFISDFENTKIPKAELMVKYGLKRATLYTTYKRVTKSVACS